MSLEIIDVDNLPSSSSASRNLSRTQPRTQAQIQTGTKMHRSTPQTPASAPQPAKRQKTSRSSSSDIIDLSFLSDAESDSKPDPINVDDPDIICTSVVVDPAKKRARELEKSGRKRNAAVAAPIPASPPIQITTPRTRDVTLTNAAAQRAAAQVSPLKSRGSASGSGSGAGPPRVTRDFPSTITSAVEEWRARPGNLKRPNDSSDSGISKKQKIVTSTPTSKPPQTTAVAVASSRSWLQTPSGSSSSTPTSKLKRPAQHFEIDDSDFSFVEVEQSSGIDQVKAESPSVFVSVGKPVKKQPSSRAVTAERFVMELGSDGEEVDIEYQRKKLKKQLRPWEGSESEGEDGAAYEYMYDAYNIVDSGSWIPVPLKDGVPDPEPVMEVRKAQDEDQPHLIHPDTSRWHPPRTTGPPIYIWDQLRMADNLHFKRRQRPLMARLPNLPAMHYRDKDFEHLLRMKRMKWFRESPGSIKQIEQKGSWTVVASASLGGGVDQEGESQAPHNRKGSLISWHKGVWWIPKGHQKKKDGYYKYYAVNDVKFDPTSDAFVSTGADKKLRVWNWEWIEPKRLSQRENVVGQRSQSPEGSDEEDDGYEPQMGWRNTLSIGFRYEPHDVLFKPSSPIFALAAKPVCFFNLSALTSQGVGAGRLKSFLLTPKANSPHITGGMVWGTDSTDGHLFASTEPDSNAVVDEIGLFDGYHKVIDVNSMSVLHSLDAREAGDAISLDTTGDRLALATRAAENRHILRLYDVRTRQNKGSSMINLEPFSVRHANFEGECNDGAFSPDGIYLAMSRNDNHTHVYDTRMLSKGPLFDYEHHGPTKAVTVAEDLYGVVKVQWVQSEVTRRMALLSAGEDGCVRLWDPSEATNNQDNGRVIAEVNSDIAHFSVGDPRVGEHQLIVGDCSGEVSCFDNLTI